MVQLLDSIRPDPTVKPIWSFSWKMTERGSTDH